MRAPLVSWRQTKHPPLFSIEKQWVSHNIAYLTYLCHFLSLLNLIYFTLATNYKIDRAVYLYKSASNLAFLRAKVSTVSSLEIISAVTSIPG